MSGGYLLPNYFVVFFRAIDIGVLGDAFPEELMPDVFNQFETPTGHHILPDTTDQSVVCQSVVCQVRVRNHSSRVTRSIVVNIIISPLNSSNHHHIIIITSPEQLATLASPPGEHRPPPPPATTWPNLDCADTVQCYSSTTVSPET